MKKIINNNTNFGHVMDLNSFCSVQGSLTKLGIGLKSGSEAEGDCSINEKFRAFLKHEKFVLN